MKTKKILESWDINAKEWINAIETGAIGSRSITNPAIIEVIKYNKPGKLLDAGCGEGWLARSLSELGMKVVGIDGTEKLIEEAKAKSDIPFYTQSFEQIINGKTVPESPYDAVVFNFCLYLGSEAQDLLRSIGDLLDGKRLIFIQTLHPIAFLGDGFQYEDQWIEDSWKGLKGSFTSPHRWYFRTMSGWMDTFNRSGLRLLNMNEPVQKDKTKPSSIIFTLTPND
ncbi:MAG: class I SAM-dependent methyltransferase [Bacteroidota bacterium]